MSRGKPLTYHGHTVISVQNERNWHVIPSTPEKRESVRLIQRSKFSAEKICWICGEKFDYGYSSLHTCGACKIIVKCTLCKCEFELDISRYSGSDAVKINEALFNGKDIIAFCSRKCRGVAQGKAFSKWCTENPEKLKENLRPHYDEKTGHYFRGSHDLTKQAEMMRERYQKKAKDEPEFASLHRKRCIAAARQYWEKHPELAYENAMKNLGLNAMPHLFEKDGQWLFLTKEGKTVPWEEYRKTFAVQDMRLPYGFMTIPTFRDQNSDNWSGSKSAFEQQLIDMCIKWFVYIKFYITNEGQLKPLVVGKSGSFLVNNSGSDISFSENVKDGPARRFLAEEGLHWCKTQVAILSCETEQEAYLVERQLQDQYGLFGS